MFKKKIVKTYGGKEREIEVAEITREEYETMNQLITTLIDIPEFTRKVEAKVEEIINNAPLEYVNDFGEIDLDKESLIDIAIEYEFEAEYDTLTPTIIYEAVHEEFDHSIWDGIEDIIREVYRDTVEYKRDPLGYHGLKQSDFI